MSIKIMSLVYESNLNKSETAILMAYADHANDDGDSVFPSIGRIAWKTKYTERAVQYITKTLIDKGILVNNGTSQYRTNVYHINIDALPKRAPYVGGEKFSPLSVGGEIHADEGEPLAPMGEPLAPMGEPLAPKPSLTIIKPSESRPEIFRLYETEIGPLTSMIAEQLKAAEKDYPAEWFPMAFKECADHNARSWKYAEACLKNWNANGFKSSSKNGGSGPPKISLPVPRLLCGDGGKLKRRAEDLSGSPAFNQALQEYQDHLETCRLCSGASNADSIQEQIKTIAREKRIR